MSIKWNSHKIREASSSGTRHSLERPLLRDLGRWVRGALAPCALFSRLVEAGGEGGLDGSVLGTVSEPSLPAPSYRPRSSSLDTASILGSSPGLPPLCLTGKSVWRQRWDSILLVSLGAALLPKPSHSGLMELGRQGPGGAEITNKILRSELSCLIVVTLLYLYFLDYYFCLCPDLPSLHFLANILLHILPKIADFFFFKWVTASCSLESSGVHRLAQLQIGNFWKKCSERDRSYWLPNLLRLAFLSA